MEKLRSPTTLLMDKNQLDCATFFSTSTEMKRSPYELAFEELFKQPITHDLNDDNEREIAKVDTDRIVEIQSQTGDVFPSVDGLLSFVDDDGKGLGGDAYLSIPLKNQEIMNGFPSGGGITETPLWSQNVIPKNSNISVPVNSESSICVGSTASATKPEGRDNQAMAATSGSSHEQSDDDDDDVETEVGPCEESTDPIDLKRIKRKVSNRESARRSRRRKQAHLADLEQQVENLQGENASLFKQLTDATQQYKDATTNNRVLKSDVQALRAQVKLAEDMVTRGSLTPNLGQMLLNLNTPHILGAGDICRVDGVFPNITVQGDDTSFTGMPISGQNTTGLENAETFSGNVKNGIMNDAASCMSQIWPWDSHVPSVSK